MKKSLVLLFVLASCSSVDTTVVAKKAAANRHMSSTDEDLSWVEQLDFNKKSEEKYRADEDEFKFSSNDVAENALLKETLSTLSPEKLEEEIKKADDSLVKINALCYLGKFDEAFKISDNEYEKFKKNTSYWNQIGTCYFLKLDFAKAILFYNKSRDLDSKYIPPVNNLGVVYQKQGKFQKALAAFKLASDLNNFSVTPTYNLAQLYLKFGTVGKALPVFQALYKKSPKDISVATSYATSLLIKGDYQSAADVYEKFNKATLSRPDVGLNYALTLKHLNRPTDAQTVFANVSGATGSLAEYASKVEAFIRN